MHKQTRWTLASGALVAIATSCGEAPATERDDPVANQPAVTTVANLPLKNIMRGLEDDLTAGEPRLIWIDRPR